MFERLKKDWKDYRVGLLIALAVVIIATALGRGVCIFKNALGIPCAGCGLTRSFLLILQGEFGQAWELHPFAYGWILFLTVFFIDRYVLRKKEVLWKVALVLLCGGMLVFYIYRLCMGSLAGI